MAGVMVVGVGEVWEDECGRKWESGVLVIVGEGDMDDGVIGMETLWRGL